MYTQTSEYVKYFKARSKNFAKGITINCDFLDKEKI